MSPFDRAHITFYSTLIETVRLYFTIFGIKWEFSNANDRQKILAFIRRCIRTGFCFPDLADFHDLYISSDEKIFNKILTSPNHILRTLLPPPTTQNYSLRNGPHNRQLSDRISRITDCNFTVRMLYRNMYWLLYILDLRFVLFLCTTAVWQFAINEYVMLCYVSNFPWSHSF